MIKLSEPRFLGLKDLHDFTPPIQKKILPPSTKKSCQIPKEKLSEPRFLGLKDLHDFTPPIQKKILPPPIEKIKVNHEDPANHGSDNM